ncbi:Origin of replication complex subunit 4 [Astathelohania contejeani]|uniref:Origin of replication complex subunit 4 n=1 Tax=Astathelohania contejeani TaxID=164912 RepID=A0ABQ7HVU3_9MICR|nr:Origin of replication complex subunit 4 [Thelohania contejeani]
MEVTDKLNKLILKSFKKEIKEMISLISARKEHFLLLGMDKYIIDTLLNHIASKARTKYKMDIINANKEYYNEEETSNKLIIVLLDEYKSGNDQRYLYSLLEIKNAVTIFASTSCRCLDTMEKRVRSRFNHNIVFIPYLPLKEYLNVGTKRSYDINPNLKEVIKSDFRTKHDLPAIDTISIYKTLNPIHLSLLIMATKKNIKYDQLIETYKIFILKCPELGKIPKMDIINGYFDLLEFGFVSKSGKPNFDIMAFKEFVVDNCPFYLRKLLAK